MTHLSRFKVERFTRKLIHEPLFNISMKIFPALHRRLVKALNPDVLGVIWSYVFQPISSLACFITTEEALEDFLKHELDVNDAKGAIFASVRK
jgi:hypothetical protein